MVKSNAGNQNWVIFSDKPKKKKYQSIYQGDLATFRSSQRNRLALIRSPRKGVRGGDLEEV